MKQLYQFLLFFLLSIFFFEANAQDSLRAENTILKVQQIESPYGMSRTKFLTNNGFSVENYNWENPAVNLKLESAFRDRVATRVLLWTAVGAALHGAFFSTISGMADTQEKYDSIKRTSNGLFIAAGSLVTGSIVFATTSREKLRKAERIRVQSKPKESTNSKHDLY
ncbi:MAG: hypothetical protein ABJF04_15600 [Reichenbachiella sp.]|uniref:hypothetical protein n=1 Tax=Reichenbachiella sp. TaxID=2184521 RepID=UPI0032639A6E